MKIISVAAHPIRLTLARPMRLLGGVRTSIDNVIVRVQTDDRIVGLGEATPRPDINGERWDVVARSIEHDLGPVLVGHVPADLPEVQRRLAPISAPAGARAAVEVALVDVLSRIADCPAHQYLGATAQKLVASGLLTVGSPESVVEEAHRLAADHGLRCFKLKVGKNVADDELIARSVRTAFPDATLYADANGGFDLASALRFGAVAAELGLVAFEEPVSSDRVDWRHRLAGECHVAVLGDESCATVDAANEAISSGLVDGVALKLSRTGVAGTNTIRKHAREHGARTLMGFESTSSVGAAASLAFGLADAATASQPAELLSYTTLADDPATAGFVLADGHVIASHTAGLGIELDLEALSRRSSVPDDGS